MKNIGIFYGSATGVTADIANRLAKALGVPAEDVHNVADTAPTALADYKLLVLGSSTHGSGDLEDDWYDFLDGASALDLKGHTVALFGTGDVGMADTFCDAIAKLHNALEHTGATFTGHYPADGYEFSHSEALLPDGLMMGLALDENNYPQFTDQRIADWAQRIKKA